MLMQLGMVQGKNLLDELEPGAGIHTLCLCLINFLSGFWEISMKKHALVLFSDWGLGVRVILISPTSSCLDFLRKEQKVFSPLKTLGESRLALGMDGGGSQQSLIPSSDYYTSS